MTLTIIVIALLIIFFYQLSTAKERRKEHYELTTQITSLQSDISNLRDELNILKDDMEYMKLTEDEKEERVFSNAPHLNMAFFEKLEKEQILQLMSGSYYYPSEEISIAEFQYKHDHINKEDKTEFGWEVHGFDKYSDSDDWSPCTFLVDENECKTSSCSGSVKLSLLKNL